MALTMTTRHEANIREFAAKSTNDAGFVLAELDATRERLATVERERDEAYKAGKFAAIKAAVEVLDNCTDLDCIAEREAHGFSTCGGGHLARRVTVAIEGAK